MESIIVGDKLKNGAIVVAIRQGVVLAYFDTGYVTWNLDENSNTYGGHYFGSDIVAAATDFAAR